MNSWYLPPIGFVFAVITATRIVESVTPFTPGRDTFFVRSAALAVVCGVFPAGTVVRGAVCDFELPHAASATLNNTTPTRSRRVRIRFPPEKAVLPASSPDGETYASRGEKSRHGRDFRSGLPSFVRIAGSGTRSPGPGQGQRRPPRA